MASSCALLVARVLQVEIVPHSGVLREGILYVVLLVESLLEFLFGYLLILLIVRPIRLAVHFLVQHLVKPPFADLLLGLLEPVQRDLIVAVPKIQDEPRS